MGIRNVGEIAPELGACAAGAAGLETLEDVLHAGYDVVDVIVQDEFNHDVIARRGNPPVWVIFDTT